MATGKRSILLTALLLVTAAACTTTTTGTAPTDVDLSGQSVEVAAVWSGAEQASFDAVLSLFAEETGANVSYVSTGDAIAQFIGGKIEGGDPPDIAMLPNPGLLADLAGKGDLMDVGDVAGELVDANYAPVWRDLGTVDGTLYGVWFKGSNKSTVWYNTQVFEDAGVSPPETWEEFQTVAATLADFGVTPLSVGGADGWTLTDWFENVYIRTAGAEKYDQLTNHEIPWTDQSVKDALATMAELLGERRFTGGASSALATDFPTSVTRTFTSPAKAAVVYEGDFVAGVIATDTNAEVGVDADFFPFPSIDGSAPAVIGGGDVAVLFTDNEAARELIRFLATPEAAAVWAERGGFTSMNQSLDTSVYPDDISRKSAEALTQAETFRFDLSDLQPSEFGSTVGQGLFKQFQDFLENPEDIDGITTAMERSAAAAF